MFLINLRRRTTLLVAKNPSFYIHLFSQQSYFSFSTLPKIQPETQNHPKPLSKPQLEALVLGRYSHGKFSDLVRHVVALPTVLFTACQNLATSNDPEAFSLSSVSKQLSVDELGREISEDRFDFEACCVKMAPLDSKSEYLVLPNLKLKVLIEAIRMVLESVYDKRLVSFTYGGRVGMGRHTALRYLKNSVENPAWWFSVGFYRGKFSMENVERLCLFIGETISDGMLINTVKKLFECEVVGIQFGGNYFGRGLPQESGLSSILLNVYFDGFDKEFQSMALRINEENPNIEPNEIGPKDGVFFKPVKIFAVRYFDEILMITSGPKDVIVMLKNWALGYLEKRLGLSIDLEKMAIHSAVLEKIEFMGMELQAVAPSVLNPPLSEKALRYQKKCLRQRQVKAMELNNARARERRQLGWKILTLLFEKFKKRDFIESEYQIEEEVREIFSTWGHEVVKQFLGSLDERYDWHRQLTSGHFLSLRHIREKLPIELVESYDKFQEQVEKHLSPRKVRKAMEAEARRKVEEEERKYSKTTVDDLTKLCMKIEPPMKLVRKAVRLVGLTNDMGRPRPISLLFALEDADIVKWYAGIGRRWLDFYCCCHNFKMVKTVVSYHLRFSCILTLAEKHESGKLSAIKHYTKDLKIFDLDGNAEMHFPSEKEVKMMRDRNLADPIAVDGALSVMLTRLASDEPPFCCIAHFCERRDTTVYRLRLLQKSLNVDPLDEEKWVKGISVIHDSLHRKCLPLCPDHAHEFYMGRITLQDLDCTSCVDVD